MTWLLIPALLSSQQPPDYDVLVRCEWLTVAPGHLPILAVRPMGATMRLVGRWWVLMKEKVGLTLHFSTEFLVDVGFSRYLCR